MKWIQLVLLGTCLCFCSCSTIDKTLALPHLMETACYAGVDNMKLYSAPNYESLPSGKVPLNEKLIVLKSKIRWAFVKVEKTGSTAWVEKTYLEKEPLGLKKSAKTKSAKGKDGDTEKATGPKGQEKAKGGVLDALGPSPAAAAPPSEEEAAAPRTEADIFDAF